MRKCKCHRCDNVCRAGIPWEFVVLAKMCRDIRLGLPIVPAGTGAPLASYRQNAAASAALTISGASAYMIEVKSSPRYSPSLYRRAGCARIADTSSRTHWPAGTESGA
jgi:hypothetical protein